VSSESNTGFIKGVFAALGAVAALVAIYEFVIKPPSGQQPGPAAAPAISVTVPAKPSGKVQGSASCDWANDWQLQSDGSYLWVGLPPGTSICQNVGQAGKLLDRMASGETLTLVVQIGSTPLGLDICSGTYAADSITPGKICASGEGPQAWPKVAGILVVRNSKGFLVGTGK